MDQERNAETENRNTAQPDGPEAGRSVEETKGHLIDVKDRLRELAKNRQLRDGLFKIVDAANDNAVTVKAVELWNEMPHAVQWALLHLPGPLDSAHSRILKTAIELGLLEYKGAKSDKDIKAMRKWDELKEEWTIRIASLFIPELEAVKPLLKPAMEIKHIQDEIKDDVRYHLKETRKKKEDAKEIAKIRNELASGAEMKGEMKNAA